MSQTEPEIPHPLPAAKQASENEQLANHDEANVGDMNRDNNIS
jgi:hypothetical protein